MRIEPCTYSKKLVNKYGRDAKIFNDILETFDSKKKTKGTEAFNNYWKLQSKNEGCKSEICNWAYELYNNLRRFYSGGVLELFTKKQTEWGAPDVILSQKDVPSSDKDLLKENQIIFRGMSKKEHKTKQYQQAWTLDKKIAEKFARHTYSYLKPGIVVKAVIKKEDVIYYDQYNVEKEVIVKLGSISGAECCA